MKMNTVTRVNHTPRQLQLPAYNRGARHEQGYGQEGRKKKPGDVSAGEAHRYKEKKRGRRFRL
jgi:hypothetical protein